MAERAQDGLRHGSSCRCLHGWMCNCNAQEMALAATGCDGCRVLREALVRLLHESRSPFRSASAEARDQAVRALEATGGWTDG